MFPEERFPLLELWLLDELLDLGEEYELLLLFVFIVLFFLFELFLLFVFIVVFPLLLFFIIELLFFVLIVELFCVFILSNNLLEVTNLFKFVYKKFKKLDVLVNNAGIKDINYSLEKVNKKKLNLFFTTNVFRIVFRP